LYNQSFKALPAFKTCSGQMESGPGAFPGFSCWRARANSSEVNSPEMHLPSGVGILQEVRYLFVHESVQLAVLGLAFSFLHKL